mmetsp:Transcript_43211/g.71857  ORF Transcript_43211/g.71857 Transcript_43211/m.71857 type:complete len:219 (-) Transcript_43211:1100-1756(-)
MLCCQLSPQRIHLPSYCIDPFVDLGDAFYRPLQEMHKVAPDKLAERHPGCTSHDTVHTRSPSPRVSFVNWSLPGTDALHQVLHHTVHLSGRKASCRCLLFDPPRVEMVSEVVGVPRRVGNKRTHGMLQFAKHTKQSSVFAAEYLGLQSVPHGSAGHLTHACLKIIWSHNLPRTFKLSARCHLHLTAGKDSDLSEDIFGWRGLEPVMHLLSTDAHHGVN